MNFIVHISALDNQGEDTDACIEIVSVVKTLEYANGRTAQIYS